jgi:hypothetical protein
VGRCAKIYFQTLVVSSSTRWHTIPFVVVCRISTTDIHRKDA